MCREMKDSGVQWIGDIPNEWSIAPLGQYLKERNEKVSDKDFEPLSVTKQGVMKQLENVAKTDNNDNRKKVCKGDFVINSRSDRKQSCGLSELDGSVSVINIVLKNTGIEEKYLKYVLKNYGFAEEFYRWGSGIVADLWSTKYEKMKRIMIPIPINGGKIGDYLDKKVSQIDDIISKQKSLIEKYKAYKQSLITQTVTKGLNKNVPMKESGIEWAQDIPQKWEVKKYKHVMYKKKDICFKYDGESVLSLTMKGVIVRDLENPMGKMPASFDGYQRLYVGNLLLCLFDIDVTPRCIGLIENDGLTSPAYSQFVMKDNNNAKYYMYLLTMIDDKKYFVHLSKNLRSSLTEDDFGVIKTIVPPIDEQKQIADFLDKKCNAIDSVISKKERLIEELERYKKSLIYECVIGKREVN